MSYKKINGLVTWCSRASQEIEPKKDADSIDIFRSIPII